MKADLHSHSTRSDGSDTVENLIDQAALEGLTHLSITEHDSFRQTREDECYAASKGVTLIRGIEISAYDFKRHQKVHILGYAFDSQAEHIKRLCGPTIGARNQLGRKQITILKEQGYEIDEQKVLALASESDSVYKQHILAVLMEKGYTDTLYGDLYTRLFKNGGCCDLEIAYVDAVAAIEAIHQDGGIAVLAHPGLLQELEIVEELIAKGLDGIEMHTIANGDKNLSKLWALIQKYHLLVTGGSDCHGKYGDEPAIGAMRCDEASLQNILSHKSITEIRLFAENMVKDIGAALLNRMHVNPLVQYKNDDPRNLLTSFDTWIDKEIESAISEEYPNHIYFSEEGMQENEFCAPYVWVVDPIDGTTNFVNLTRDFSISVCFFSYGRPTVGVVYDVFANHLYSAEAGRGAWINNKRLPMTQPPSRLKETLVDMSLNTLCIARDRYNTDLLCLAQELRGHRAYGAASLSIIKIALGELHFYVSGKLNLWDHAAAALVLKEAGGSTREPVRYAVFSREPKPFLASASPLLESLIIEKIEFIK